MTDSNGPMLDEYQALAATTNRTPNVPFGYHLLGLFGETGSLLSVAKKKHRDSASYLGYSPNLIEELGDVLWHLSLIAKLGGIKLSDIGHNLNRGYADWQDGNAEGLHFNALQSVPFERLQQSAPTPTLEKALLDLASDIGNVLAEHKAGKLDNNKAALEGALLTVMRSLVRASDEAGVTLGEAAEINLKKIFDRWPTSREYPPLIDEAALPHEKLPRLLTIDVFEREVGGGIYVFQQSNGINIGDRLTDNAVEPDDYRFHDVFHYAYCAVLGWSPVVRALLRLKRKSDPVVDEAQDGARANLIEEGIASWIFGQAKQLGFFHGMKPGELSFDLLKMVRQFVAGYEPEHCPLWLWEEAILQGFHAFRFLKQERCARLRIDMSQRQLHVSKLSQ